KWMDSDSDAECTVVSKDCQKRLDQVGKLGFKEGAASKSELDQQVCFDEAFKVSEPRAERLGALRARLLCKRQLVTNTVAFDSVLSDIEQYCLRELPTKLLVNDTLSIDNHIDQLETLVDFLLLSAQTPSSNV
ncbi:hypothetical protein BOX15_Mlig019700g1, partial [Macrostomum lignano]